MTENNENPVSPENSDTTGTPAGFDGNTASEAQTPDIAAAEVAPQQPTTPQPLVAPSVPVTSETPAAPTAPTTPVVPVAPVASAPATPPVYTAPPAPAAPPALGAPSPYSAPANPTPHVATAPAAGHIPPAFGGNQPPADHASVASTSTPKSRRTVGLVAALAVAAIVGGLAGAGVVLATNDNGSNSPASATVDPTSITVNDPGNATTITAVAAKVSPSVVTISVSAGSSGGTGSGVILSKDGYILTNTHVVTLDGASSDGTIKVQLNDGRLFKATVVGTDPTSDLAVIKVAGVTDLQPAEFADSSKLNVGDGAIAIGAPLGLAGTVTDGIVSALNRSITIASSAVPDSTQSQDQSDQGQQTDPFKLWGFDLPGQSGSTTSSSSTISLSVVQTDAAINPGNSGGALLNSQGQVIGINVAIASASNSSSSSGQSGSIGVGFAIPSNLAKRVSSEIIADGSATHGLLGANIGDVSDDANSTSATVGATVQKVISGGAAEKAGIKAGDVITQFNGFPITGATDLTAQVRALAAGADAKLTYVRNGSATETDVTLGTLK